MLKHIALILVLVLVPAIANAQEFDPEKVVVVEMNDGATFTGRIVSSDAREIVIRTADRGDIALPKYNIRVIRDFGTDSKEVEEDFASRYFISTNGIPIREGESYINWTLFGPDLQFGYKDNLGFGLMTTWLATPVVLSAKRTFALGKNRGVAVGLLAGGNLWGDGRLFIALPYVAGTVGDRNANATASVGWFAVSGSGGESDGRLLFSFGGMAAMNRTATFVFDSVIIPGGTDPDDKMIGYLIPGIRIQTQPRSAFQIGFGGILSGGESIPAPFISWFRAF
jgi:hypothetical protein